MPWKGLGWLALAVFLTRAPFVPPTLEDYDSVNFALALERFDPLAHQPHPPGFPVYVALAVLANAVVPEPSRALGLLSALSQALAVFPAFAVFSSLAPHRRQAWLATLLLFASPVVWFNGARPLSDSTGLLFALAAQALLLRHLQTGRGLVAGSLVAGVAVGVRLQTVALTAPLWLLAASRRGPRAKAIAALALGGAAWLVPLLVASGGPARYLAAFGHTMATAFDVEPIFMRFSVNLAARAAGYVLLAPSIELVLGGIVLALVLLGAWHMGSRHRERLALALLCFGPYLLTHALFHHVEAIRYAVPYLPMASLLVAAGIGRLAARVEVPHPARTELGMAALLVAASATLTVPALWVFSAVDSPPEAAVKAVREMAGGTRAESYVLVSHYTLQRYLGLLPERLEVLRSEPNRALARLSAYWIEGGAKQAVFLADPRRTDLASIDPRVQRRVGRWEWPLHIERFMTGARPARAELLQIGPPDWIAGPGWLLSLEAGRPEQTAVLAERSAFLRPLDGRAFLLIAGEPAPAMPGCTVELDRDGAPVGDLSCDEPFLQGLTLEPGAARGPAYVRLRSRPLGARGGGPAPVLLRGLDYGPSAQPGCAHGTGWHYPERDERARLFRWTAARTRSLVHVPAGGAALVVEGVAPVSHVGTGGVVRLLVDGIERARAVVAQPAFRLETLLPEGRSFRETQIVTDRTFIPDLLQRNGDLRQLGVRIYRFELTRTGPD
jgi:hypothetical protein